MQLKCYKCGTLNVRKDNNITRRDTCDKCSSDLRCCKNCAFYSESSYNQCRETQADRITDKENSNFCDYFSPSTSGISKETEKNFKKDIYKQLDALFK